MGTDNRHPDGLDVELVRYPPIRGVLGSGGKGDAGWVAGAVLDTDWRQKGAETRLIQSCEWPRTWRSTNTVMSHRSHS